MARYNGKEQVEIQSIRNWCESLRRLIAGCEASCDLAEQLGLENLDVTHWKTGQEAVEKMSKFAGAVFTAASASDAKAAIEKKPSAKQTRKKT